MHKDQLTSAEAFTPKSSLHISIQQEGNSHKILALWLKQTYSDISWVHSPPIPIQKKVFFIYAGPLIFFSQVNEHMGEHAEKVQDLEYLNGRLEDIYNWFKPS